MKKFIALLALVALFTTAASAQSIADIARQKSSDRKAKRVITDDDMPSRPAPAEPAPAAGSAAARSGDAAAPAQPAAPGQQAAPGAQPPADPNAKPADPNAKPTTPADARVKEITDRIERLKGDQAGFNQTANDAVAKMENAGDEFEREMYQNRINNARTNIGILAEQIRQAEAELQQIKK